MLPKRIAMHYDIQAAVNAALREDVEDFTGRIPTGDHSALACFSRYAEAKARLLCKAEGIIAGVELAEIICRQVDPALSIQKKMNDGDAMHPGDVAFTLQGDAKSILRAERVILNYMQRMSAIATLTRRYVDAVAGTGARILDTRKTTPGFRYFEKWAVRIGGGFNHRMGLYDMIMLKDNHIDFCGGIEKAILAVEQYQLRMGLQLPVEVETRNLHEVEQVLRTGKVTRIMFDNFDPHTMKQAVAMVAGRFETEASGGINLHNVRSYAETGVDFISVGALTHSAGSLDMSLKAF
ncbi:MAG: carboxylating nicotinate-nucleotide diphosphorylase [Chitinophagales bacterium]|nr:carboxylating nicotinate-nucleotide diphosphorylase [Chitinophagales bacterium]MDW8420002.1 carboxylating nicotinate-nucleotide diphosphorylase [Chitinophagales bacterium]